MYIILITFITNKIYNKTLIAPRLFEENWRDTISAFRGAWCVVLNF